MDVKGLNTQDIQMTEEKRLKYMRVTPTLRVVHQRTSKKF